MVMDKAALRRTLVEQRLNLPDRLQRADALQQVMRIWLIHRPDTMIGAYWPIRANSTPARAAPLEDGELLDEPQFAPHRPAGGEQTGTITFHATVPPAAPWRTPPRSPNPGHRALIVPLLFIALRGLRARRLPPGLWRRPTDRTLAAAAPPTTVGLGYQGAASTTSGGGMTCRWMRS